MARDRPNILILFTDMQRADTIRALGNPVIRTPQLDRLVREGTAFTNCYSPSPVCVPARCCMHYGQYPQKTGLFDNGAMMEDNEASYPAVLGANGYRTHAVGKCHFTPDALALRGFQTRQCQEECTADPERDDYIAWLRDEGHDDYEPHGARGEMYYIPQVSTLPAEAHPTQWVGDQSVRFINEASREKAPWCLFSSFIHPHPPFAPPKPWHKLYRVPDMPLPFIPENSRDLLTWINRSQNRYKYRDRGLDFNLVRAIKAYYYATISFIDFQVGRVLDALEEAGVLDSTIILFASDHGEYLGDFGCFGKRGMHDASARVPLIIRYPDRFPDGARCATATSLCDLFPTILGAARLDREGLDLDGVDLAGIVHRSDPRRTVYAQFEFAEKAIYMAVSQVQKYVYSAGDQAEFFFERREDAQEVVNLADAPDFTGLRKRMKNTLLDYLESVGAREAVVPRHAALAWHAYPRLDESYLEDPDAGLLVQDYPSYPTVLPGYSDV
jgi:choline-sulfatase